MEIKIYYGPDYAKQKENDQENNHVVDCCEKSFKNDIVEEFNRGSHKEFGVELKVDPLQSIKSLKSGVDFITLKYHILQKDGDLIIIYLEYTKTKKNLEKIERERKKKISKNPPRFQI